MMCSPRVTNGSLCCAQVKRGFSIQPIPHFCLCSPPSCKKYSFITIGLTKTSPTCQSLNVSESDVLRSKYVCCHKIVQKGKTIMYIRWNWNQFSTDSYIWWKEHTLKDQKRNDVLRGCASCNKQSCETSICRCGTFLSLALWLTQPLPSNVLYSIMSYSVFQTRDY